MSSQSSVGNGKQKVVDEQIQRLQTHLTFKSLQYVSQEVTSAMQSLNIEINDEAHGSQIMVRVGYDGGDVFVLPDGRVLKRTILGRFVPFKPSHSFSQFYGPFKMAPSLAASLRQAVPPTVLALIQLAILY